MLTPTREGDVMGFGRVLRNAHGVKTAVHASNMLSDTFYPQLYSANNSINMLTLAAESEARLPGEVKVKLAYAS
ncbi:MAG: hypothetical protein HOP30_06355 [Cyclobacteriaceae bacterium]|nr:hypothetical protein [Cyclobacteriaceae bacterium]